MRFLSAWPTKPYSLDPPLRPSPTFAATRFSKPAAPPALTQSILVKKLINPKSIGAEEIKVTPTGTTDLHLTTT